VITQLSIQNYALIDSLSINFKSGFTVITGETGSGKSVLLGALGLILGQRVDHNSIRDKEKKCIVEGIFTLNSSDIKHWFSINDFDFESETILRREISSSGKSRAFINDTPVSLAQLKELGQTIIDIHSQHQTRLISSKEFIIEILDSQASQNDILDNYRNLFKEYQKIRTEIGSLEIEINKEKEQLDYINFLKEELSEFDLYTIRDNDILSKYELLSNAEEIRTLSQQSQYDLNESDNSIISKLNEVKQLIGRLAEKSNQFEELYDRFNSSIIELEDISSALSETSELDGLSQNEFEEVESQYNFVNRMLNKHNCVDLEMLILKYEEFDSKTGKTANKEQKVAELKEQEIQTKKSLEQLAKQLSNGRRKIAPTLEKQGHELLSQMKMPNAFFKFDFTEGELSVTGNDQISLLTKTNKGSEWSPIEKVASGGETSRIMLAIKSLQSQNKSLPTIIFDEIDTGVSGQVAEKMGNIMQDLGSKMQVISITHLPQIAAKGSQHIKVFKEDTKDTSETKLIELEDKKRIDEIANMLSGDSISKAAIEQAKTLLNPA